jgi:hypothetical protein
MFLGSRARPVSRADNLASICEPIVYTMWDPQHLTACYGDSLHSNIIENIFHSRIEIRLQVLRFK